LPVDPPGVPGYGLGMCISPDELSNEQLLDTIAAMRRWITEDDMNLSDKRYYAARIERYEGLLKERADNGTYADH
jgi:hypothetical protein